MANRRDTASPTSLKRRQERLRKAIRRQLHLETLEDRRVFASPQLVSINPNNGDFFNLAGGANLRNVAPRELTFRFADGQMIDPATVTLAADNVRVVRAGPDGNLGSADDVTIVPGYVGIGEAPNEVVLRFKENLVDDKYRVTLVGSGANPISNLDIDNDPSPVDSDPINNGDAFNNGQDRSVDFELDLGAQIIAIVPQPMVKNGGAWSQQRDRIEVYFNNDDLNPTKANDPNFYRLYFTNDSVQNTDDNLNNGGQAYLPSTVVYDAALDKVTLTFPQLLTQTGTFRLRIGTNESAPLTPQSKTVNSDAGSSFATASNTIGTLGNQSQIISSDIEAQPFPLLFPGAYTEPGHREVFDSDPHTNAPPDQAAGTPVVFYNFASPFGSLAGGPAFNLLNEPGTDVKEVPRIQEALDMWGKYLGIKFVQTNAVGDGILTIAKGDPFAFVSNPWTIVLNAGRLDWNYDYGENWYQEVLRQIGAQIKGPLQGLTGTGDLPPGLMGGDILQAFDNLPEPVFPTQHDFVHGQYLWRPDSIDIDLYKFRVQQDGVFTAEAFAERLANSSSLDTVITVFRETTDANGNPLLREMIARNDDYFSEDSLVRLDLKARDGAGNAYNYYIGVSASGGSLLDPTVPDSTMGGTSQGRYDLRLNFRENAFDSLSDADNSTAAPTQFDGDHDGVPGGAYNFWFRSATEANTIFVDKANALGGTGTANSPYREIDVALAAAKVLADAQVAAGQLPNVTVRILPNGTDPATAVPYQLGTNILENVLEDGRNLEVPRGVNLMIDAGVLMKLRNSIIQAGSTGSSDDRSRGTIQVLGTPTSSVYFTSYNDDSWGGNTNQSPANPTPGNWGGIVFLNDRDHADQRYEFERHGIFVNYVNHADIRYGGGQVAMSDNTRPTFSPITMIEARPTLTFNRISLSADVAMSADANSFEETNFHAPNYQVSAAFTSDYDRVGPDIYGNVITNNSLNGLFVRIATLSGEDTRPLAVAGRFDDLDITHIIKENLLISGTPGGGLQEVDLPPVELVRLRARGGGTLAAGTYNYRLVWVDASGNESPASLPTASLTISGSNRTIRIEQLPPAPQGFVARRLYRSEADGSGPYTLVAQINPNSETFDDNGTTAGGLLNPVINAPVRARLDASLVIDPGIIVKLDGSSIETGFGTQLLAEGTAGAQIIFTSVRDDRYGAGGTFDLTGGNSPNTPAFGDWAGIFAGATSTISLDNVVVAYGGGVNRSGGNFTSNNAVEIHQADARITNSIFEFNATGMGGQGPLNRFGQGFNEPGTIFVRESQPIIVDNVIRNNEGAAININTNSLNHQYVVDTGRNTGPIDRFAQFGDNQGPLIRLNRLFNDSQIADQLNGMEIRGETLRTEGVWDDTDIVHVLFETIYVPDFHTFGGLRLESSATERLVVKLEGPRAGFSAMGRPLDVDDRIGGILHIVGQPGLPVILTSLRDDTVGAGVRSDGRPQNDTNGDGELTTAAAGDWRSVRLDQFSHDRNVEIVTENEASTLSGAGSNGLPSRAQLLGQLAPQEKGGDENRRLGYSLHGFISNPDDVDVYTFIANAGTEVWFDIDRTSPSLDTVIELISADGVVRASSDNSYAESVGLEELQLPAMKMQKQPPFNGEDHWSQNVGDSGMRVVLPGPQGTINTYHIRVRSKTGTLNGQEVGLTSGLYKLQIRLREFDEVPGSTIRFSDIRYARNGVEVFGQPGHSPLVTEATETGASNDFMSNAIALGELRATDRAALAIAGALGKVPGVNAPDVDFYRFTTEGYTSFDLDYADGIGRLNTRFWVFNAAGQIILTGDNSNVSDDRPGPLGGTNLTDLTRGTVGSLDPYVGTAFLPIGTYYVAVAGQAAAPAQLSTNSLLRLEPILSSRRLVEDHIGHIGGTTDLDPITPAIITTGRNEAQEVSLNTPATGGTFTLTFVGQTTAPIPFNASANQVTAALVGLGNINPGDVSVTRAGNSWIVEFRGQFANTNVSALTGDATGLLGAANAVRVRTLFEAHTGSTVPFNLGDVTLFVSEEILPNLGIEQTRLSTIDPFTGALETMYGGLNGTFPYDIGDMALRFTTGQLHALRYDLDTPPSPRDSVAGNYLQIDTGTGQASIIGDDGILTYELGPDGVELAKFDDLGYGVHFDAMSYLQTTQGELLYAVGHRGDNFGFVFNNGPTIKDNILYAFLPGTGEAVVNPGQPRIDGAGTDAIEMGEVLVAPRITVPDPTIVRRNPIDPSLPLGEPPALVYYTESLQDGQTFEVLDGPITTGFEFDIGYEIRQNIIRFPSSNGPISTVEDGDFFVMSDGGPGGVPDVFQFDAGIVLDVSIPQGQSTADGFIVTIGGPTTSRSFEFNYKAPLLPGQQEPPPRDVTAKQLDFSTGTTTQQLAALLADAINGEQALGVGATAVGTRITMTNERFVTINPAPGTPAQWVSIAGDFGAAPVLWVQDPTQINDGDTFTLSVTQSTGGTQNVVFEFNSVGAVNTPGARAVNFNQNMTPDQVIDQIVTAAASTTDGILLTSRDGGDMIAINGNNVTFLNSTADVDGLRHITPRLQIPVEESFSDTQIGAAVKNFIDPLPIYEVGAEAGRINFHGALTMDATGVPAWTLYDQAAPGVASNNAQIKFFADDTPERLADRIELVIDATFANPSDPANPINSASTLGNFVRLDHGDTRVIVQNPNDPFRFIIEGAGPGGVVTGMTTVRNQLYAVSNRGGLYRINPTVPVATPSVATQFVQTSRDDLEGINFQAISAGPVNVEGGRYIDTIFGMTEAGRLYAFDTTGVLQPIFADGVSSVETGATNVRGIAFGNLDTNLWHQTGNRALDLGHGIEDTFESFWTGFRLPNAVNGSAEIGGTSMYFGAEPQFNYNFAGGAYGTVISDEFSLKGYSPLDAPTLYFNYLIGSGGGPDSFRVFASDNSGEWQLLADSGASTSGWFQARVDLAGFAGLENLRLRFDVSSAGDMNVGDTNTTGDELRAVDARYIEDGDIVVIDGDRVFEFEMGQTIVPSTGAGIYDGQTLIVQVNANPPTLPPDIITRVFEFDSNDTLTNATNVRIPFNHVQTSAEVARNIRDAINASGLTQLTTYLLDNRLNVKGLASDITDVLPGTAPPFAFSGINILGNVGVDQDSMPVDINVLMDRETVANVTDAAIEAAYVQQSFRMSDGSLYFDEQTFQLIDVRDPANPIPYTFEIDTGYVLQVPDAGMDPIAGLADGDTFTISDGVTSVTYEFDADQVPTVTPGNRRIIVSPSMTQPGVAQAIASAIDATPAITRNALALDGIALGNGRVQLSGPATPPPGLTNPLVISNPRLLQTGLPGVATPGNIRVFVSPTYAFKASQVAANVRDAINSIPALNTNGYTASTSAVDQSRVFINKDHYTDPNLQLALTDAQTLRMRDGSQYTEGQTFQVVDNSNPNAPVTYTFELDSGYTLEVPLSGMGVPGGMRDGDTFTISDGNTTILYEFEIDTPPFQQTATHRAVFVGEFSTQAQVAQAIAQAINGTPNPGRNALALSATVLGRGLVQVSGPLAPPPGLNTPIVISNPNMKQSGIPGVALGNHRVYFTPLATYTADQIALNVQAAFNNIPALNADYTVVINPADPAELQIIQVSPPDPPLGLNAAGVADILAITEWIPQDVSKQYRDLLRVIGHTVTSAGPLGLELEEGFNTGIYLQGDVAGHPIGRPVGFNSIQRAQANNFEGFYLDDIIIGFAERGEMYTAGTNNASFNVDPALAAANDQVVSVDTFALSPYQLEIRRGEEYGLNGSIETNDRLNQSYQLTGLAGSQIVDGQSFTVGDGIRQVRFEFNDTRIFPSNGVQAGSIEIPFHPLLEDWQVAARVRDAINSAAVQAVIGVQASTADHAHTNASFSTSNQVNLLGPAVAAITGGPSLRIVSDTNTANELRDYILGPGITPVGDATLISGANSAGIFDLGSSIGMETGIILSTGSVTDAEGPNQSPGTSGNASLDGDDDLDATFGELTEDTTSLEFQFQFAGGDLQFDFVFASEEYREFVNQGFNDVFAFYVDGVNIAVLPIAGPPTPISIDTVNHLVNTEFYVDNDPASNGPFNRTISFDGFTEMLTASRPNLAPGVHTIKLVISDVGDTILDSAVFVRARSFAAGDADELRPPEAIPGRLFDSESDTNLFRDQGQILIHSNTIRDSLEFGINVDAGQRYRPDLNPFMGTLPHAGAARVLRDTNNERLAPGVVVQNNVIARATTGGIHFSGDANNGAAQTQQGVLPFGRIVNNTIYDTGIGIDIRDFAAPTVLNNIVADSTTGVFVDASSGPVTVNGVQNDRTILGGMLFQGNATNTTGIGLGDFPIVLANNAPLFVNPAVDNYYLEAGSLAIDSSVESLEDRANLVSLRSPLGISQSPILAPNTDVTGQLRVDDPSVAPPQGLGQNVFKDRGAVDRVDTAGPTAQLVFPLDNGVDDTNPVSTEVITSRQDLTSFRIQLTDGLVPSDPLNGSGIDDLTVIPANILSFTQDLTPLTPGDGRELELGVDYTFSYDATNNVIILTPLTGIWASNASYVIVLDNSTTGILDLAGNPLKANQLDLSTRFTINIGTPGSGGGPTGNMDFGDAPSSYPVTLPDGARHSILSGFQLGASIDVESNGQPTTAANGDGADDDGVTFVNGTTLVRGRSGTQLNVIASEDGVLNAWIDFNRDGDWDDAGEQIFTNRALVGNVSTLLDFNVPTTASLGDTYARFRLNKTGNLGPSGPASNGEVEDYALNMIANPWQNPNAAADPNMRFDVSGDNRISPLDALLLINRLNFSGPIFNLGLPAPGEVPPYLDVNGDGAFAIQDAAEVINFLNFRAGQAGESMSVDVNPTASATGVAAATSRHSTSDGPVSEDSASSAGLAPVAASSGKSVAPAVADDAFDYGAFAPESDASGLPLDLLDDADDRDEEYEAILGGGSADEAADDFFAWFGQ